MYIHHWCSVKEQSDGKYNYNCYGSAVTEVGVDVLTGETRIERVDILHDCGDRWGRGGRGGGGNEITDSFHCG